MTAAAERIAPERLRSLFLFESLTTEQLEWLAARGRVERHPGGTLVYVEGDPADAFYVLLSGEISLLRRVGHDDLEVTRTAQSGAYAGAMQAYLGERMPEGYLSSLRTVTDAEFFVLPSAAFDELMHQWFPMAAHLLEGLYFGMRTSQAIVQQRERLLALGTLSAGLTHELNNPAAAAWRAGQELRGRMARMRQKLALLAGGEIDRVQLQKLTELQEAVVARSVSNPPPSALEASDREDELGEWFEDHGIAKGWDIAPVYVAAGLDVGCAEEIADSVAPEFLEPAIRWLAYTLETEALLSEITDSCRRISDLIAATRQYSQLDRAPHQVVDVHSGLESTLTMLKTKMGPSIKVRTEFDRNLPEISAYPAELNQVWTNLIDNALAAMKGHGTLTLRTRRDDGHLLVEVGDTGPGIPDDILPRIFDPFFTTKPVGSGTGLGLDISYRIVVKRHRGDLRVTSAAPGDTRITVRLPLDAAAGQPTGDPAKGTDDGRRR